LKEKIPFISLISNILSNNNKYIIININISSLRNILINNNKYNSNSSHKIKKPQFSQNAHSM